MSTFTVQILQNDRTTPSSDMTVRLACQPVYQQEFDELDVAAVIQFLNPTKPKRVRVRRAKVEGAK